MLAEWITYGGLLFWGLTAIAAVAAVTSLSSQNLGTGWLIVGLYIVIMTMFSNLGIWDYVTTNTVQLLRYVGMFLGAGLIWAFIKWLTTLAKIRRSYATYRTKWLSSRNLKEIPVDARDKFINEGINHVRRDTNIKVYELPPKASEFKGDILTWVVLWPASMVGTAIGDFMVMALRTVWEGLHGSLQRISNAMFNRYAEFNEE